MVIAMTLQSSKDIFRKFPFSVCTAEVSLMHVLLYERKTCIILHNIHVWALYAAFLWLYHSPYTKNLKVTDSKFIWLICILRKKIIISLTFKNVWCFVMASNKYLFMECLHSFWGSILNFNGIMITFNNINYIE